MAINTTALGGQNIVDYQFSSIEVLTERPTAGEVFTPERPPGQLVAFFNGSISAFELYVVSSAGNRFYKVS